MSTTFNDVIPLDSAGVEKKIENQQIYPATSRVEINDKFAKIAFQHKFFVNKNYRLIEKKNFKPKGKNKPPQKLITNFSLSGGNGDEVALTEFDRAVLSACISEYKAGNLYTTVSIIFRALIGDVGNQNARPRPNQYQAIVQSLASLMGAIVNFKDLDSSVEQLGYVPSANLVNIKQSAILPAVLLDCNINGQFVEDVLYFDRQSPLLERAEIFNQIVRYPTELLDVPNQNNTPLIITLKNYVIRRIAEIKLHKNLQPTITFADVFKKCNLDKANRHKQFDARNAIIELFEHLKIQKFIKSYEILKHGVSVYGVAIQR